MPTKKQLEAIIEGLGFDPSMPLENYVKIGAFLFPKTSAVTLNGKVSMVNLNGMIHGILMKMVMPCVSDWKSGVSTMTQSIWVSL